MWGGGVNLTLSTPSGAESKEVVSADYVGNKFSSAVSNCIAEIPQDIKLELKDGVLTLKAGSNLWYPDGLNEDGSKKFATFVCPSDLVLQGAETGLAAAQRIVVIDTETYKWTYRYLASTVYSGDVAPTASAQYGLWYDTTTNFIKRTTDTGATWTIAKTSFPVCLYTRLEGGTVSGVDTVFNGFGYIGSSVFVLPGVKVRIPNGVDTNGTPKYRPFEVERVMTYTIPANENCSSKFYLGDTTEYGGTEFELFGAADVVTIRTDNNLYYDTVTGRSCSWLPIASALLTNGVISSFVPCTVDPAVDGNMTNITKAGQSVLSGFGLPSNRYVDLTLGATESVYIAPANGVYAFAKKSSGANQYIRLRNLTNGMTETNRSVVSGSEINEILTCMKGDNIEASYTAGGDTIYFRFIYASGEA